MTNIEKTNETVLVTEVRKAALSTIKGESQRAAAAVALSSMGVLSYNIPQDDIVEAGDITKWLKGDDDDGIVGFVKVIGFQDWSDMDPITKINSTMQDVLREVAYVVAAGEKHNWWATKDNKNSDSAVITKDDTIYVKTKNFPGMDDDTLPVRDVAFRRLYSAARRVFAKPTADAGGKNDAAFIRRLQLMIRNDDGDVTLAELSPEAIELLPKLLEDLEELMTQFDEAGHQRHKEIDVAAVA